jgi:hypothetical protein
VGIPLGADLQIQQAVAGELVEHVIEEGHTGAHPTTAAAIEAQVHAHIGFTGDTVDTAAAAARAAGIEVRKKGHGAMGRECTNHAEAIRLTRSTIISNDRAAA